jgi:hypothetical protein
MAGRVGSQVGADNPRDDGVGKEAARILLPGSLADAKAADRSVTNRSRFLFFDPKPSASLQRIHVTLRLQP